MSATANSIRSSCETTIVVSPTRAFSLSTTASRIRRGSETADDVLLVLEATGRGVEFEVELDGVLEVDDELDEEGKLGCEMRELVLVLDAVL